MATPKLADRAGESIAWLTTVTPKTASHLGLLWARRSSLIARR